MMLRFLPAALIACRFVLGPILFADALDGRSGIWFGVGLVAAVLSDIFDGILARRLGVATAKLREIDSWVDAWFCLWIAACAWLAHRAAVVSLAPLIAVWLGTDWLALAFDWLKFRRFAAYHALSSKLAGLLLFTAIFTLFVFGESRPLMAVSLCVAILSHAERMAITAILPAWTPDVLSVRHALRLRHALRRDQAQD